MYIAGTHWNIFKKRDLWWQLSEFGKKTHNWLYHTMPWWYILKHYKEVKNPHSLDVTILNLKKFFALLLKLPVGM